MKKLTALFCVAIVVSACTEQGMKVGSSSMEPTLHKGDKIIIDTAAYETSSPILGDIILFKNPQNHSLWISRIVGLPGDTITYGQDKVLTINGKPADIEFANPTDNEQRFRQAVETLGNQKHKIIIDPTAPFIMLSGVSAFPSRENCKYEETSVSCKIPADSYFVMGDNRDESMDSRYWGFVPKDSVKGKLPLK